MKTNRMCAFLGNLHNYEGLAPLTDHRPVATLPFDSKYRLIDFNLSSIANSNIHSVFMVFNYDESRSVFDHLGGGTEWNLDDTRNLLLLRLINYDIQQQLQLKKLVGLLTRFQKHLHIVTSQSQRHISIPKALLSKQLVKQPSESSKRTKGNFRESFDFRAKKDTQDKNLECLETLI